VIRVVNLLFLLSFLPWTFIAFMVLLIVHVPEPPPLGVQIFRALFFSYPIAVILSRFASSQAERRNNQRLALTFSLLPFAWFLAFAVQHAWETRTETVAATQERTEGDVYPCGDGRVVKVRSQGEVWLLEGRPPQNHESVVGYLSADGQGFRPGGVEADLSACTGGGRRFLDVHRPVSHVYACPDGRELRLDAYGEGDFVHLVGKRLPDKVFFARITRGTRVAFVYDGNSIAIPQKDDAARRALAGTCRNAEGRSLLDVYTPAESEHIPKSR
jgi:hypothetical protein